MSWARADWTRRGDHVLVVGGPWPERVGRYGWIIEFVPTARYPHPMYPWAGLGDHEVVIYIEQDPVSHGTEFGVDDPDETRGWTCVIDRADIEVVA